MEDKRKILVTGADGLVGSTIDCDVPVGREYDLRSYTDCENLFKKNKPTHIIHCAGKVGGLGANMNLKGQFYYDNIMINTNIIELSRLYGVKKLVAFLSTCIFPDNIIYPLDESKIHLGEPHFSNYPYAYAKRMIDIQIRAYNEQYGLNYFSVIPTNIYGPKDNFSLTNGHVIPMLIHKMYLAKKNSTSFVVWGTGKAKREFIFSEDVGKITTRLLDDYDSSDPLILSNSEEIKISDLVDLIANEFNFQGKIIFDNTKPDGQIRKPTSNHKLLGLYPDIKFTSLENGLKKTINWFIENYENARK